MRFPPRTKLTAPPGQEPPSPAQASAREDYSPGFAVPEEPGSPSRWHRGAGILLALLVLTVVSYAVFRVATGSRAEDPSLQPGEVSTTAP